MLLIDGVRYEEWVPTSEDELEQFVKEHAQDIFGEQSIYLDRKQKLKSLSGIGSIPDGYVIVFGALPEWHIVEVELSSHPLYEHIVSQVSKFINGISNPNIQRGIVNAIYGEITREDVLRLRLKKAVEPTEIYKFLSDLISKQPILTVIIEKDTEELGEALATLRYPRIKVVEFRTFAREGVGLTVHAHLFKPLYRRAMPVEPQPHPSLDEIIAIEIEVQDSYRKYSYIGIKKKYRDLFPDFGETIELTTDEGDVFAAKVGNSGGSMELWDFRERQSLREWYDRNRHLKKGDRILITPIGPKKYYLHIIKSER
jgi:hypothetical protein